MSTGDDRAAPDLIVTDPRTRERCHVEVKYRSARPTSVQLDADRIDAYRQSYPGTILDISSAWDGAVYCAQVEEVPLTHDVPTLSLLENYWRPIWHYVPLVEPGERLRRTWRHLQDVLAMYGSRQAFGRRDRKLWEGEYEALARYLEGAWEDSLLQVGIDKPQVERMTLEERWDAARRVSAATLADELLGLSDETPIESPLMSQTVSRALGSRGEENLVFDLTKLSEALGLNREDTAVHGLVELIGRVVRDPSDDSARELANRLVEELKDGVGEVYLVDQALIVSPTSAKRLVVNTHLLLPEFTLIRNTSLTSPADDLAELVSEVRDW